MLGLFAAAVIDRGLVATLQPMRDIEIGLAWRTK
jgi:hypothetical protein